MAKTNLEQFLDSVEKAKAETMTVIPDGGNTGSFIVTKDNVAYNVTVGEEGVTNCTCPNRVHRKAICKHMVKVALEKGLHIEDLGQPE